jgi:hypothetical protein
MAWAGVRLARMIPSRPVCPFDIEQEELAKSEEDVNDTALPTDFAFADPETSRLITPNIPIPDHIITR